MGEKNHSEDFELVKAAQADIQAFSLIYDRYFSTVFRFINSKVRERNTCADLSQQVFLKAMLSIHRYQDRGKPLITWLFRIAANESNMYFRKNKKTPSIEVNEKELEGIIDDTKTSEVPDHLPKLIDALNSLSIDDAQLIDLRYFDQLSFAEIAAIYDAKEPTVKMKVYRILDRLKSIIEKGNIKS